MQSVAHSRKLNKASVTLSNNNDSFSGKTLYDDVYGGPPKFGVSNLSPRFEDYSEIFGTFHTARATSIPVLDLPAVLEAETFFDPRSNRFNYTEVFGALDFAVSKDSLVRETNGLDEEARTSAETDSFSGESSHSGNNQSVSNGDLFRSVVGNTEFNISYHQINGMSNEHMSKGETHMNRLHAVPGFSQVYDETTRSNWIDPSRQVDDDIDLNTEFSADKVKENHLRKTMPCLHNFTSGEQTVDSDLNLQNGCSRNDYHFGETFLTASDISLRSMPSQVPPPSRPPPVLDAKKGDTYGFHSNGSLVCSEETPGDHSPTLFDVEVDMSSSGAASADAMKEAMLRAEAKLRSAKELKERKKWDYESHVKSTHDLQNNETQMTKDACRLNSLNDETMQASYDSKHSKTKISATDERHELRKASSETLNTLEGKGILNTFEENRVKESRSSQDLDKRTEVGTWKEEYDFFELKGTDEPGMVIQPTRPTKILLQDTRHQERGQKERETSKLQEKAKKVNATEENDQRVECEKKSKAEKEAYPYKKNIMRSEAYDEKWRQREHLKKEKVTKIFELEENVRIFHQYEKTEKKLTDADLSGSLEDVFEMGHKEHQSLDIQKSREVDRQTPCEVQLGMRLNGNGKKPEEVQKQQKSVKKHKHPAEMKENGKGQGGEAFALGEAEYKDKLKDSVVLEAIDEMSREAKQDNTREKEACRIKNEMILKQILNKKELKEVHERVIIEKGLMDSCKKEEGLKHTFGQDEDENGLKEDFELDVNGIRLKEAFTKLQNNRRENTAYERDQNRKNFEKVCDGYGEGNIPEETGENKGIKDVLNQASEKEQSCGMLNEIQKKREIESTSNQTFGREGSIPLSNENDHSEQYENVNKDAGRMAKDKPLDKALGEMEGNEGGNMKFAKAIDDTWETESSENLFAAQSASIHEENIVKLEVSLESAAEQKIGNTRTECKAREKKLEYKGVENQLANENIRAPKVTPGDTEHSGRVVDTVTKANYRASTEVAEPATAQEGLNVQKYAQWFHVGQSTKRKEESLNETPATVVKDSERIRRERESGNDCLRKVEDERDRERVRDKGRVAVDKAVLEAEREKERIKDRMAVDRAIFEAHDRAYAEAYERTERDAFERATVEARHRALAEAKERLEKACAEARDKSYIDKVTTEARLKAECAAVERATAEAQERTMEKLKAESAEFESRERLERSVSEKIGVCSRNDGMQDSTPSDMLDPQFQNCSSSIGSKYPYSLYGAASFSVRSEREGESALRCRARLERHHRTAERVAKALAEKNMRDLLVQKEQMERNRLAETLDAEVRRWSSGKQGNLRALLSTLQYILGPGSGWQPIPLTEVITSAGVKKAYRKATLCVHPDKLQQRGASIQHKYICEKVFDLLKDAWNKFNSEER